MSERARFRTLGAAALLALVSGCYVEAGAEPAYVEAEAPVAVEAAPQSVYEGRTVYYVNNRWYARDRGHWVYYRYEPEPLSQRRGRTQPHGSEPQRDGAVGGRDSEAQLSSRIQ